MKQDLNFIRKAQYHLKEMTKLLEISLSTPHLAETALWELHTHIEALDELVCSLIDPGNPNEAREQLKQKVIEYLGELDERARDEWSQEAKQISQGNNNA
jgi:hypothetical protein